jgi:hypothetical protein
MQRYGGTFDKDDQTWAHSYGYYQHTRLGCIPYQEYSLDTDVASKPTQNILLSWCSLVVHQGSLLTTTLMVCVMCFVATLLWPSVGVKPNTWKK